MIRHAMKWNSWMILVSGKQIYVPFGSRKNKKRAGRIQLMDFRHILQSFQTYGLEPGQSIFRMNVLNLPCLNNGRRNPLIVYRSDTRFSSENIPEILFS